MPTSPLEVVQPQYETSKYVAIAKIVHMKVTLSLSPRYSAHSRPARALVSPSSQHVLVQLGLPYLCSGRAGAGEGVGQEPPHAYLHGPEWIRVRGMLCSSICSRPSSLGSLSPPGLERKGRPYLHTGSTWHSCRRSRFSNVLTQSPFDSNTCPIAFSPPAPSPTCLRCQGASHLYKLCHLCAVAITLSTTPKPLMSMVGYRPWEGLVEHMDRVVALQIYRVRIS
jgi:hypothetical protein